MRFLFEKQCGLPSVRVHIFQRVNTQEWDLSRGLWGVVVSIFSVLSDFDNLAGGCFYFVILAESGEIVPAEC